MFVTIFESKKTQGKNPISPYTDGTFDFRNVECNTSFDMFGVLARNFILNLPLKQNIKAHKRKSELKTCYPETFDYILLNIGNIKSKQDQISVLKYFKQYKCVLGESRSANNIDNFNLKGFLFTEPMNLDDLKLCIQQIHEDLAQCCDVDTGVSRVPTHSAPINKIKILMNTGGKLFKFVYRPDYKSHELSEILKNNFKVPDTLNIGTAETIDQICLKAFESMGFQAIKTNGNCIVFQHPSEVKSPGGYFWFRDSPYVMRHYNEAKNVNIFNQMMKYPEIKALVQKQIDYNDKLINFDINTSVIKVNERFLTVSDEIRAAINTFLMQHDGLFAIRSPMGTAKSVIIGNIIQQALEQDFRILICANRISVAEDYCLKYNIKIYNKDKYKMNDSFIVQYDSLWKYSIKNFDLVILDEFISLLLHSRSNLNNTCQNLAKFFACFNKKLVISDALLTGYENFLLQNKKDNLWLIDNQYRDDVKLIEYTDYNYFVQAVLKTCKKHKATISCTSLNVLYGFKLILQKYKVRAVTLTAETPDVTKHLIYECFKNPESDKFDVLLYSPTLTVGVSNLMNTDYHFHYDSSSSCDVISSMQMIKRTRKAKEIHFYIKNRVNCLKTTYKEIRDDYIANLGNTAEHNYLFEMNDYGEPRLSKIGKKAIQIDLLHNILEVNHRNAFLFLIQYQFRNPPEVTEKTFGANVLLPYINEYKESEKQLRKMCLDDYFMVSDISGMDNLNTDKAGLFDDLEELELRLKCSPEVKKEILTLQLNDSKFIEKCYKYSVVKKFMDKELSETDIRYIIGARINDIEETRFWNAVLGLKRPLAESYLPFELKNGKLKDILMKCGYRLECVRGVNRYVLGSEIAKYREFVRII